MTVVGMLPTVTSTALWRSNGGMCLQLTASCGTHASWHKPRSSTCSRTQYFCRCRSVVVCHSALVETSEEVCRQYSAACREVEASRQWAPT